MNSYLLLLIADSFDRRRLLDSLQVLVREGLDLDGLKDNPQSFLKTCLMFSGSFLPDVCQVVSLSLDTLDTLDPAVRLEAAYHACSAYNCATEFWFCYPGSQLDKAHLVRKTSANESIEQYESLVQRLAIVMAQNWAGYASQYLGGWRALFQAAVSLGGLRNAFQHDCQSPMLMFLWNISSHLASFSYSSSDFSHERLTHKLRYWASEVLAAGQDLQDYGAWEHQKLFGQEPCLYTCYVGRTRCFTGFHVVNFAYGPDPSEWKIWVALSADEPVGDFFESLEDPDMPLDLPGAWPTSMAAYNEDTQNLGSIIWSFSLSRRHRWRMRRYYGLTEEQFDEDYDYFDKLYEITRSRELRRDENLRREQFFKEAGISPIPNPPY